MRKKIYTYIFAFVLFCAASVVSTAQDAVFSQYFASAQYFNPSLVATETEVTISGITRTQWKSVDASYQTSMIGVTFPLKDKLEKHKRLGGFNISVINDESADGNLSVLGVNLTAGYGFHLSERNIVFFGVMGGYYQKSLNIDDFKWGSQFDPTIGWDANKIVTVDNVLGSKNYFDINTGMLYVYDLEKDVGTDMAEIYVGVSAAHLTQPNESLLSASENNGGYKLPIRFGMNLGAILPIGEKIGVSPNVMYISQGAYNQLNMGVYGIYYLMNSEVSNILPSEFELGAWHRLNDSFIFNIGLGNELYHLGFSFDLTSSNLNYNSGINNAYEISFKLKKPHKKTERHYTPRF